MKKVDYFIGDSKENISEAGMNFTSDIFRQLCIQMNIEQTTKLSYHHQSNGQVEACIQFIKHTVKIL